MLARLTSAALGWIGVPRPPRLRLGRSGWPVLVSVLTLLGVLLLWEVVSVRFFEPTVFPPLSATLKSLESLLASGELIEHVDATLLRIAAGFVAGGLVGLPVGLLMGTITRVRLFCEPYIQFFRFIPPIAWLSPMTIWLGVGEVSKIALVFYTTSFIVILNTMAGVFTVGRNQIRAARSMGGTPSQIFRHVILPGSMAHYLTGLRLGMGNAFMTVVAAEMIGGRLGLGFLILDARVWSATDKMFGGILIVGTLGFLADRLFQLAVRLCFARFLPRS